MNVTKEVYESREDMRNALKRIEAENKALSNDFHFQVKENCRIANKLNEVEASRDELLHGLQVSFRHIGSKFIVSKNLDKIIKRAESLKEKPDVILDLDQEYTGLTQKIIIPTSKAEALKEKETK